MNKSTVKAIEDFLMVKSDKLEKAPLCFCFGFPRKELYEAAAKMFKSGFCDYILISGGVNKSPDKAFDKSFQNITEAKWQRDNLIKMGVPEEKILIEPKATNSLENVLFSKPIIIKQFGKVPKKIIVLHKVFHGRRALMTIRRNLSKDTKYLLQLFETPNHELKNWWKNKKLRNHLIDEVRKIGEYALKGNLGLD
ncbi:YdcF family protein [Patescibacteria group bacterium]|nr:MAG: YdcF family protein [Patescibacteria group bacterium]